MDSGIPVHERREDCFLLQFLAIPVLVMNSLKFNFRIPYSLPVLGMLCCIITSSIH